VDVAEATHPHVERGTGREDSDQFERPDEFLRRWNAHTDAPADDTRRVSTIDELASVRAEVRGVASDAGMSVEGTQDLCLATNEILTNALVYGTGPVDVWTYVEDEFFVVGV